MTAPIQVSVDQISKLLPVEARMRLVSASRIPDQERRRAEVDKVTDLIKALYPQFFRNQGVQS